MHGGGGGYVMTCDKGAKQYFLETSALHLMCMCFEGIVSHDVILCPSNKEKNLFSEETLSTLFTTQAL